MCALQYGPQEAAARTWGGIDGPRAWGQLAALMRKWWGGWRKGTGLELGIWVAVDYLLLSRVGESLWACRDTDVGMGAGG